MWNVVQLTPYIVHTVFTRYSI